MTKILDVFTAVRIDSESHIHRKENLQSWLESKPRLTSGSVVSSKRQILLRAPRGAESKNQ